MKETTNEEKAREIANCNKCPYNRNNCKHNKDTWCHEYRMALEMAEWKDKEFAKEKQTLIDKACELLEYIIFDKVDVLLYDDNDIEFVKTISGKGFADIFKKVMKETK